MKFTPKQSGVAKGMLLGFISSVIVVAMGLYFGPFGTNVSDDLGFRTNMLGNALLLPTVTLVISIARLARHRFVTSQDIDGSGLTVGSEQANILQSLLQNTLEQFCITLGVYTVWCFVMPINTISVPLLCSFTFLLGRALFFHNYQSGAPARALGFTLTFYPTVLMTIILLAVVIWRMVSEQTLTAEVVRAVGVA